MTMTPEEIALSRARLELEDKCAYIAKHVLKPAMPPNVGFTLLLFDFGAEGNMAYISTANRDDMIKAMHEFIEKQGH